MNILIVSYDAYPHIGGKSTHIYNLTKGLTEIGHTVKVISYSDISMFVKTFIIRSHSFVFCKIPVLGKRLSFSWTSFWINYLLQNIVVREIKTNSFDAISCQDIDASNILAKIRKKINFKIPIITTVHGDYTNEKLSAGIISKGTLNELKLVKKEVKGYLGSDVIITVDNRLKEHVTLLCGNKLKKQPEVMFNFLDISEFNPISDSIKQNLKVKYCDADKLNSWTLLCPRRLTAKNGVVYAALMMKHLLEIKKDLNIQLLFAGSGKDKHKISKIINKNKLFNSIKLLGDVKHEEIINLYAISDAVIIPSVPSEGVIEATSLSALESMACGIPVIASNIGGLSELIKHRETGMLVAPHDVENMAEAVLTLMQDKNLRKNISNQACQYIINHHSHLTAAARFASICEKERNNV